MICNGGGNLREHLVLRILFHLQTRATKNRYSHRLQWEPSHEMCCPRQCGVSATSTTLPPPPPPSESPHCSVQSPVVKQTFHYPYPHRKMLHNRRLNVIIFKIIHQSYPQKYDAIFCCFFQVLILATNLKCVMTVDCTTRLYQKADNQNVNNLISCHVARHERVEKNFSSSAF